MKVHNFILTALISAIGVSAFGQSADSLIVAQGKVINAATKEPVTARIVYSSLPYGNKVGVLNSSAYSFPMFDNEKYSITVEASGFAPVKYMLDPNEANGEKKVIKDIELSNGPSNRPAAHAVGQVMRLNNLIFEVGNSKIDPESYSELDILVNMMQENPGMVIQLEGHTDYVGSATENLKLSQRRVDSIRNYLGSKGIQKSRVKTKAFGGAQPLSRDDTPEAHRLNRRVEVRILQN